MNRTQICGVQRSVSSVIVLPRKLKLTTGSDVPVDFSLKCGVSKWYLRAMATVYWKGNISKIEYKTEDRNQLKRGLENNPRLEMEQPYTELP